MAANRSIVLRGFVAGMGLIAVGVLGACASAPKPASVVPSGSLTAQAVADSSARLLECVHSASASLGYTPVRLDNPARGRFRRVDAQGNDGEWFVAEAGLGRTKLIAEAWADSAGRLRLYVTAYQTNFNRITGVEPGREKNRRLGAFFQASIKEGPGNLTPDVVEDLAEIRATCATPGLEPVPAR